MAGLMCVFASTGLIWWAVSVLSGDGALGNDAEWKWKFCWKLISNIEQVFHIATFMKRGTYNPSLAYQ